MVREKTMDIKKILDDIETSLAPSSRRDAYAKIICEYISLRHLYNAAIRVVSTKLEILDEEFEQMYSFNPIHHIESRLKSPESLMEKVYKNNIPLSTETIREKVSDIAGVRVICHYINDVYSVARMITAQDDVEVIKKSDYIKNPKNNGYRSLHLVVTVPVSLSRKTERVPVEIQIRTIAMDFWASLEHKLKYKSTGSVSGGLFGQLKECAEEIAAVDYKMQEIYNRVRDY